MESTATNTQTIDLLKATYNEKQLKMKAFVLFEKRLAELTEDEIKQLATAMSSDIKAHSKEYAIGATIGTAIGVAIGYAAFTI